MTRHYVTEYDPSAESAIEALIMPIEADGHQSAIDAYSTAKYKQWGRHPGHGAKLWVRGEGEREATCYELAVDWAPTFSASVVEVA